MSLQATADIVQRGDPERFRAAMAAPVAARAVLFPLYAFNVEVARAPWATAEAMIAEMRLQWWRDVLTEIADGKPVRRHEVTTPLAEVLDPAGARALDDLVAARRWDIYRDPFPDEGAFSAHIDRTAGTLMWVSARALGAPEASEPVLRDIGYAQGLAAWLRAIPDYEARGRLPLPDGRPGAVQALAREGLRRLRRGRMGRHGLGALARTATYPSWTAGPILSQAARDPSRVAEGRLHLSEFRTRAGLLMTAATGRV